jgi:hypothetical protein
MKTRQSLRHALQNPNVKIVQLASLGIMTGIEEDIGAVKGVEIGTEKETGTGTGIVRRIGLGNGAMTERDVGRDRPTGDHGIEVGAGAVIVPDTDRTTGTDENRPRVPPGIPISETGEKGIDHDHRVGVEVEAHYHVPHEDQGKYCII